MTAPTTTSTDGWGDPSTWPTSEDWAAFWGDSQTPDPLAVPDLDTTDPRDLFTDEMWVALGRAAVYGRHASDDDLVAAFNLWDGYRRTRKVRRTFAPMNLVQWFALSMATTYGSELAFRESVEPGTGWGITR